MASFRWLSHGEIPKELDLRRRGWDLATRDEPADDGAVAIVDADGLDHLHRLQLMTATRPEERRMMLVSAASTAADRAYWLATGFGDVVGNEASLEELEARARRLSDQASWIPRKRAVATLELDLLDRTAKYDGRLLNLHPREFEILWRLAETPDEPVSRAALLRDVWRQDVMPESNSIAVHISRLRGKLAAAGLDGLVEMGGRRGYLLRTSILKAAPALLRRQAPGPSSAMLSLASA